MRKLFFLFLLSSSFLTAQISTVQTHSDVVIQTKPGSGQTNYSGWGEFPSSDKTYSKVIATLTFECAPGLRCGEWDYLNYIFLGKRRGDKKDSLGWEIMRFITPYGFYWRSSDNWKHGWKFDITDFGPLFHDSIEIIYRHTGYEKRDDRGWKINLSFELTEGKPERDILSINHLVQKRMNYTSHQYFAEAYEGDTLKVLPNSDVSTIKVLQTGHGSVQPSNCGEFCDKKRYIKINGETVNTQTVWRDDCGENSLFPQAGTWVYDRAGWCPGDIVYEDNFDANVRKDTIQFIDFEMENYIADTAGNALRKVNGQPQINLGSNYRFTAYHIEKGPKNFQRDLAITDIVSPSDWYKHKRYNPSCGLAKIEVRNQGKDTVRAVDVNFGFNGNKDQKHWIWQKIAPGETAILDIPIENVPSNTTSFDVEITKVNDVAGDDNSTNNAMSSPLSNQVPSLHEETIIIFFKTNNAPTENSYRFFDAAGRIVYERKGFTEAQTIYRDTFKFYNGCFQFEFDDRGPALPSFPLNEDGLGWWANTTDGNGIIQFRKGSTGFLDKNFAVDFGTKFNYFFTVGHTLNTSSIKTLKTKVYPNPAKDEILVEYPSTAKTINVFNSKGQQVLSQSIDLNRDHAILKVDHLPNGIYAVEVNGEGANSTHKVIVMH